MVIEAASTAPRLSRSASDAGLLARTPSHKATAEVPCWGTGTGRPHPVGRDSLARGAALQCSRYSGPDAKTENGIEGYPDGFIGTTGFFTQDKHLANQNLSSTGPGSTGRTFGFFFRAHRFFARVYQ